MSIESATVTAFEYFGRDKAGQDRLGDNVSTGPSKVIGSPTATIDGTRVKVLTENAVLGKRYLITVTTLGDDGVTKFVDGVVMIGVPV